MIMKQSEIVKNIREEVVNNPIKIYEDGTGTIIDPSEEFINKAFLKICDIWNGTPESRNFLRHLIQSFIPLDDSKRVLRFSDDILIKDNNRCCILGIKVAGIADISEKLGAFLAKKAVISEKADKENRGLNKAEEAKLTKVFSAFPVEIQNATSAYSSENSHKFLSVEAGIALEEFIKRCTAAGERDIMFTVNGGKKIVRQKKNKEFKKKNNSKINTHKQRRFNNSFAMASILDDATIGKLSKIK